MPPPQPQPPCLHRLTHTPCAGMDDMATPPTHPTPHPPLHPTLALPPHACRPGRLHRPAAALLGAGPRPPPHFPPGRAGAGGDGGRHVRGEGGGALVHGEFGSAWGGAPCAFNVLQAFPRPQVFQFVSPPLVSCVPIALLSVLHGVSSLLYIFFGDTAFLLSHIYMHMCFSVSAVSCQMLRPDCLVLPQMCCTG